jgi:hypothetical protein
MQLLLDRVRQLPATIRANPFLVTRIVLTWAIFAVVAST